MRLIFYLPTFSTPYMDHLLYLMFRCNFDVMESLEELGAVNTAALVLAVAVRTSTARPASAQLLVVGSSTLVPL